MEGTKGKKAEAKATVRGNKGVKIVRSCTIQRPAAELFKFWRDLENLPRVMKHLISVTQTSEKESHWVATMIGDKKIEWDSVIINEHPGELIAWRTKEGADFDHAGSVRFEKAPGGRGTEVTVALEYVPPGGKLATMMQTLLGEVPAEQVEADLQRFKALIETGELPTIKGQSVGAAQRKEEKKR